jgi:hypothetical protein
VLLGAADWCRPNLPSLSLSSLLPCFSSPKMGQKPVSFDQAVAEAKRLECHSYVECSSKTTLGLEAVIHECVAAGLQGPVQPVRDPSRCLMS